MVPKVLLVVLTEFLITKVTSSYYQPYSASYVSRDPRSFISYRPDQSYYKSYAPKVYQRPTEVITQIKKPVEYRQPPYQNTPGFLSPVVQRTAQIQPSTYPVQVTPPKIETTKEFRPQTYKSEEYRTYQGNPEMVTSALYQQQQPTYQKITEMVAPKTQAMELLSPTCQKSSELLSPLIQASTEYHQPAYEKVAQFVAQQKPVDFQQSACHSCDLIPFKQQTTQMPLLTSLALESLTPKCECSSQLPLLAKKAMESIKSLGFPKSEVSSPKSSSETLDTNVLNNLAIALQLLIVNNIMNHPKSDSLESSPTFPDSLLELVYPSELPVSNPYNFRSLSPTQMPNSKFLGSSNFGDDNLMSKGMLGLGTFGSGLPLSRPGFNLMSPYDAISSTSYSPFSDSAPSLFALKNNFQSPYAAIMAADNSKDLFLSDLF